MEGEQVLCAIVKRLGFQQDNQSSARLCFLYAFLMDLLRPYIWSFQESRRTGFQMLAVIAIRALEGIFVIGMLGCVAVVILTTLEDIRVMLGKDDHAIK